MSTPSLPLPPSPSTSSSDALVKPGVWTTEHVLTYVSLFLSALYLADVIPTSGSISKIVAVASIMLTNLGYQVTRSLVKSSAHKVMVAEHAAISALAHKQLFELARFAANAGGESEAHNMITRSYEAQSIAKSIAEEARGQSNFGQQGGKINLRALLALGTLGVIVATIMLYVSAFGGCASTKEVLRTMSGNFQACAKADLGQLIQPEGTTLLGDVAGEISGNKTSLEADLTSLAKKVGLDAVKCAVAATIEVLAPSSAQKKTGQDLPGVTRARDWLKSAPADASAS